ncbi:MAG: hypothetical protein K6E10_05280 [Eubacterium sp.]|nr:hypothetical protein [Eubacterium sp.]
MSLTRTKKIHGILMILVMLHHLGQMVSASWLPTAYRKPGMEFFVPIGYLLVAFFFFSSGYGLIKSANSKEKYFDGFLVKRLNSLLFTFVITNVIYLVARTVKGNLDFPANPNSWYIYNIIFLYIAFFFIYRKIVGQVDEYRDENIPRGLLVSLAWMQHFQNLPSILYMKTMVTWIDIPGLLTDI